jgi:hypothetical protein
LFLKANTGLLRVEVICKIENVYDVCKFNKLITTSKIYKDLKLPNSNSNSRDNNQTTPNSEVPVAKNRSKDDTTATRGDGRTNSNDNSIRSRSLLAVPSTTDRNGPAEKDRNGPAEKTRNGPAEKIRNGPVEKDRNGPAEKIRNGPAEKIRNGLAEKIRNGPAENEGAGGGADLDSSKRLSGQGMPRQTQYRTPRARKNFGIRAVSTPQVPHYLNLFQDPVLQK